MNTNTEIMLSPEQEAVVITERIKDYGRAAVNAICNIGKDLRRMKIEGLYTHLGYETFEDYAEKEFNLKRRQSYLYISVYEKLGEDFVQSNAQLGITKLALLAQMNAEDRAELMEAEDTDLNGMTTKEVEELVSKYKEQGEQLSMLQEENEELKSERLDKQEELEKEIAELREKLEGSNAEILDLQEQVEFLENAPKEVQVAEPVVKEVIKEVPDKKTEKKLKEAEKKLKEKEKDLDDSRKAADERIRKAEQEKEALEAEVAELRKAAEKPPENVDKSSFKAMFASAYKEITGLIEFVKSAEPEDKPVFAAKVEQLLDAAEKALKEAEADVDKG